MKRWTIQDLEQASLPFKKPKRIHDDRSFQIVDIISQYDEESIVVFGRKMNGQSVCCRCTGFMYNFFFNAKHIDNMISRIQEFKGAFGTLKCMVDHMELVEPHKYRTIHGYTEEFLNDLYRVYIKPEVKPKDAIHMIQQCFKTDKFELYECDFSNVLRFMLDTKIHGCSWVNIDESVGAVQRRVSTCDDEYLLRYDKLKPFSSEVIAPMKVLSFDIECENRPGVFPTADNDSVIHIGLVFAVMEPQNGNSEVYEKRVLVLGDCSETPCDKELEEDVVYFSCQTETELFDQFRQALLKNDPDIITGYNTDNFDFKYMVSRAQVLGNVNLAWGKLLNRPVLQVERRFSSNQAGTVDNVITTIHGRICIDVYKYIKGVYKLRSYKLDHVADHFLKLHKIDMPPNTIGDVHRSGPEGRRRIAEYCIQDSILPLRLSDKLMIFIFYIQFSIIVCVNVCDLINRGEQIRLLTMLSVMGEHEGVKYLVRSVNDFRGDSGPTQNIKTTALDVLLASIENPTADYPAAVSKDKVVKRKKASYKGAIVIDPVLGFFTDMILVYDFASLYPSIMIAFNLCFSTFIDRDLVDDGIFDRVDYHTCPNSTQFVKRNVRIGRCPEICETLLLKRANVKKEMKTKDKNDLSYKVLDIIQSVFKRSTNSVYGNTARFKKEVSEAVTQEGQRLILHTKRKIETVFGGRVVYGDTDSVMFSLPGCRTLDDAFKRGAEIVDVLNLDFPKPIRLEFEKVYSRFALLKKKKYYGLKHEDINSSKLECKGIEVVRRDNCPLVGDMLTKCINIIIYSDSGHEEIRHQVTDYVKGQFKLLVDGEIPIEKLIITKEFRTKNFKVLQPHVYVYQKMCKRDESSAPKLGDRIMYVNITTEEAGRIHEELFGEKPKDNLVYVRAEDVVYVKNKGLQIDYLYYIKSQLTKPLQRILSPLFGKDLSFM